MGVEYMRLWLPCQKLIWAAAIVAVSAECFIYLEEIKIVFKNP